MPFGEITLKPGVNLELTPTRNMTGYQVSAFGRFRAGLFEKIGGWQKFWPTLLGTMRALWAWQDFSGNQRLAAGSTSALTVITNDTTSADITPQTKTTNPDPDFSTTASSATVTITDLNVTTITTLDAVEFLTPVSVGGIILSGLYPVAQFVGSTQYRITAASAATLTRANLAISNITQGNPAVVTYVGADNIANGDLVYIYGVVGMTQVNNLLFTVANLNTGANTFQLTGINSTGYTAYSAAGTVSAAAVPFFSTTSGSATVTVTFQSHGLSVGSTINFPISTSVGGITISGTYTALSVSGNTFTIAVSGSASSSVTAPGTPMNSGAVRLKYYITIGPASVSGTGWGVLGWGVVPWGGTGAAPSGQTGTPITPTDWTLDNWGQTLLACPANGGLYAWDPSSGNQQAQLVSSAPPANSGMLVTAPVQIVMMYGSTQDQDIGYQQDPLEYKWSDLADFNYWTPGIVNPATNLASQAGNNRIPTGSAIKAGLAVPQQVLLWTDLDLWAVNYLGRVSDGLIFGQTKVGANCGAIARHGVAQMSGVVYWWGRRNFYLMAGGSPQVIPCTVWDIVFQNLNTTYLANCWIETVTSFNEVWFFYPSTASSNGECDSYAKINVIEAAWDYGSLPRSAGIDQSVAYQGPLMSTPLGLIYKHESGYDADGTQLTPSFTSGYSYIGEGEDYVFVDQILPDFKFQTADGTTTSATLSLTFNVIDFMGDTPRTYGPYAVTSTTQKIDCRIRGRQWSITVTSSDVGSWWRLGKIRYRFAPDGRR